jgi:predicted RNA binding protein YcfA (HicA-like mRNA interferase family)
VGKFSTDKNIDSLVRELLVEGWQPSKRKRHWQVVSPKGTTQTIPLTPSDNRAFMNFRSDIKRIKQGVKV